MEINYNNGIKNINDDNLNKIKLSIDNLINNKSKFIFCVPNASVPSASVYEIYFHATVLKRKGYDTYLLVEDNEYTHPYWIENDLLDHKVIYMDNPNITVNYEDVLIIPEIFSNIMEYTKNLPCLRIVLFQSIDYMFKGLLPGVGWDFFGINDVITTSYNLKEFLETFFGKNKFNIYYYNIGIPNYFEKSKLPQKPIVSIIGRNQNDIIKFIKLFFAKYPQFSWITFDPLLSNAKPPQPLRRIDFANKLKENFAAVWIDRISSFGTFPLECMKSGVMPICLKPDLLPDYLIERNENGEIVNIIDDVGIWSDNIYELPVLLANYIIKFLDDVYSINNVDNVNKIISKYTQENAEKELFEIYRNFLDNRLNKLKELI